MGLSFFLCWPSSQCKIRLFGWWSKRPNLHWFFQHCGSNASQTPPYFSYPRLTPLLLLASAGIRSLVSEAWLSIEHYFDSIPVVLMGVLIGWKWGKNTVNKWAKSLPLAVGTTSARWTSALGMQALCRGKMLHPCPSWEWPCDEQSLLCNVLCM